MDAKDVVKAFVAAHNRHDLEGLMACLTEDAVMIDVAAPIPLDRKADVGKLFTMIFSALPDINFEITGLISEGDRAFAALRTTGTGRGTWAGRDIVGKRCDVFEGMFVQVRGAQIATCMFYSDTVTLSRQLGDYAPALDMKPQTRNIM